MKLDSNEELRVIAPEEMRFLFELSDKECHQKQTGKCSLERWFPDRSKDIGEDCDYDHCPRILKELKRQSLKYYIDVIKYGCGHFAFNDGQHRVCIAKKKGLKLKALITTEQDKVCDLCRNKSRNKYAELR